MSPDMWRVILPHPRQRLSRAEVDIEDRGPDSFERSTLSPLFTKPCREVVKL